MNPLVSSEAGQQGRHALGRCALSVNVNRVALLRNSRPVGIPDVVRLSTIALEAGADGITVHPRPDARHITTQDVRDLSQLMRRWPQAEYNLEGNPFHNLMELVREVRPHQATFVPDSVEQATSDHGWDLVRDGERLRPLIDELHALGVRVSLFMDPDPAAMALARAVGADRVELYTEAYARSHGHAEQAAVLARYAAAAQAALSAGLGVNAGHDLNRDNLADFLRAVPGGAPQQGAFTLDLATGVRTEYLSAAGLERPRFRGVNADGLVTGFGGPGANTAFVGNPATGEWTVLRNVPAGTNSFAYGINDAGAVVGYDATTGSLAYRGWVATPVPEPATWALWGLGLAALGAAARRR